MQDKSLFESNQPRQISEGLQNFIDSMVEEIVLEGKTFDKQKKYLKKFSENEGLDYDKLVSDVSMFLEILDKLKTDSSSFQVNLAKEKGRECHISEPTIEKLLSQSLQKESPKKLWPLVLAIGVALTALLVVWTVLHKPDNPPIVITQQPLSPVDSIELLLQENEELLQKVKIQPYDIQSYEKWLPSLNKISDNFWTAKWIIGTYYDSLPQETAYYYEEHNEELWQKGFEYIHDLYSKESSFYDNSTDDLEAQKRAKKRMELLEQCKLFYPE